MNELTALALELQTFCETRNWRFCLIGGLAVRHWGEPRFTRDVDMPAAQSQLGPFTLESRDPFFAGRGLDLIW